VPAMPYNLEKGPYLSMFEDLLNRSPEQLYRCLQFLRDPARPVTGLLHEFTADIPAGPFPTTRQLAAHIDRDWFGLPADADRPYGTGEAQPPWSADRHDTTGFWTSWYGDSHAVVRTLFIRACEISLDLAHGEEHPAGSAFRRHWPLNLFTICGIRWFEGWLNWRRLGDDPGAGLVTVLLLTPSHGKPANPRLVRHFSTDKRGHAPYALDPPSAQGDRGLWVVGLRDEVQVEQPPVLGRGWSSLGAIDLPRLGPTYVGSGEVVVVATPEGEGGVLPHGRDYQGGGR
jgi:hypothetical protein